MNRAQSQGVFASLIAIAFALFSWIPAGLAEPPNPKTMRLYANGPLTRADYSSKPADTPKEFAARTDTELRYHLDVETLAGPAGATCQVKRITFYAMLNPKTTWADPNRIDEVLDHEQGHFDITQKHVLLAKAALEPKVKQRMLIAAGATPELARAALAKLVEAEVKLFAERGVAENKAYDEATRHGTIADAQAEWRERQKKELAELSAVKGKKASPKKPAKTTRRESEPSPSPSAKRS